MNTDTVYRYIGNGAFVVGLPARDIQEWEVMQDADMLALLEANLATAGACYEKVERPAAEKVAKKGKPVDEVKEPEAEKAG